MSRQGFGQLGIFGVATVVLRRGKKLCYDMIHGCCDNDVSR